MWGRKVRSNRSSSVGSKDSFGLGSCSVADSGSGLVADQEPGGNRRGFWTPEPSAGPGCGRTTRSRIISCPMLGLRRREIYSRTPRGSNEPAGRLTSPKRPSPALPRRRSSSSCRRGPRRRSGRRWPGSARPAAAWRVFVTGGTLVALGLVLGPAAGAAIPVETAGTRTIRFLRSSAPDRLPPWLALGPRKLAHDRADERSGVAEEHQRLVQVVEGVGDSREAGGHASLDHHHRASPVHVQDRHAV